MASRNVLRVNAAEEQAAYREAVAEILRLTPTAPLGLRPEPLRVSAIRRVSTGAGDLIDLIAISRRYDLEDGIERALSARRAERPKGQRVYRDRARRAHRARMDAATAFEGERA